MREKLEIHRSKAGKSSWLIAPRPKIKRRDTVLIENFKFFMKRSVMMKS
jgi:hypothetical protein